MHSFSEHVLIVSVAKIMLPHEYFKRRIKVNLLKKRLKNVSPPYHTSNYVPSYTKYLYRSQFYYYSWND